MCKSLFLAILLILSVCLSAQTAESVLSSSLEDSLQALEAASTAIDSFRHDPVQLKKNIDNFIKEEQNQSDTWFPWWTYSSNKHYITLKNTYLNIKKNGFMIYPHRQQSIRIFQSNRSFYHHASRGHTIELSSTSYALPVTLTLAEAGMGDFRNMHGSFNLRKGHVAGFDSTAVQMAVAGINGYWFGDYDTAANIHLQLSHKLPAGRLELSHTSYNEEYPSNLSDTSSDSPALSKELNEEMLYYQNRYLDLGLRYEYGKNAGYERNQLAVLARKQLTSADWNTDLSVEYLKQSGEADSSWFNLSLQAETEGDIVKGWLSSYYINKENYFGEMELTGDLYQGIGILGKAYSWSNADSLLHSKTGKEQRYGGGLTWRNTGWRMDIIYGNADDQVNDDWFMETYLNGLLYYRNLEIKLRNWLYLFLAPELQMQNELELFYHLPPDNGVRLQLTSHYYTEHYSEEENFIPAATNLDLLLGIKISDKFEIRLQMVNLTNSLFIQFLLVFC
jgi:hypothetical protein